jgi:uncharacterized tellurite resistance protein B-like protein
MPPTGVKARPGVFVAPKGFDSMICHLLALAMICQGQSPAKTPPRFVAPVSAAPSEAEIYRIARSALIAARNKAANVDVSLRKSVTARETEEAMRTLQKRFGLDRETLSRIIAEGETADGTAARKQTLAMKRQAKLENQVRLAEVTSRIEASMAPKPRLVLPQGISAADYTTVMRSMGVVPYPQSKAPSSSPSSSPSSPSSSPSSASSASSGSSTSGRETFVGPRGGVYHYSKNGNKVYEKRK